MSGLEIFHSFPEAVTAGMMMAVTCSFLGVFVVLKRLVFIGATLSEVAACGIAASLYYQVNPFWGAIAFTMAAVTLLAVSQEEYRIPRDSIMAVLFVLASCLAILFVAKSSFGLEEVKSFLYGDLILTSSADLRILSMSVVPVTLLIFFFRRPVIYTFLDQDEAKVLGIKTRFWELCFYYAMGIVISAASKLGGMLLVFCYLVVPPIAGLILSNRLFLAVALSVLLSIVSTLAGFYISYQYDLPTNQVIGVTACFFLALIFVSKSLLQFISRAAVAAK